METYNPLDKINLGRSVADALLSRPIEPLVDIAPFNGAGIYAIYLFNSGPPYEALNRVDQTSKRYPPVYVGKAVPSGGRKGRVDGAGMLGRSLFKRLDDHRKSIGSVNNLDISEIHCRYLVVDDIWIPLGESLMINRFSPVWNMVLDGFGNHDPGKGRHQGLRPRWDVLHPGRHWAESLQIRSETSEQLASEVSQHLETYI